LPPGQIDLFRAPEQITIANAAHEPNECLFVSSVSVPGLPRG
jgi:hypothetical protein